MTQDIHDDVMVTQRSLKALTQRVSRLEQPAKEARRQALEEARDRLMCLQVDLSAIHDNHKTGMHSGFGQMRARAQELLTEMLEE